MLIIHSSRSLPGHMMPHKDIPFIAAYQSLLLFFPNFHQNGNFFSAYSACIKDTDIQWRRNVCTVGRGERAAAAEFPRTRGGCAVPGPGAVGDGQHVCFWGENISRSPAATSAIYITPYSRCRSLTACVPCRAVIRRPMCGTCVRDSAFSPLKPMSQTSTVCGKLKCKALCVKMPQVLGGVAFQPVITQRSSIFFKFDFFKPKCLIFLSYHCLSFF